MEKLTQFYWRAWRPAVLVLSLAAVAYLLYFRHLGSLVPGYSSNEIRSFATARDWHGIATNPVNAPYKVLVWLLTAATHHGSIASRMIAAGFGTLAVLGFYAIIRPWYSFRVTFLATLLFATSAGFLHVARLGTPQILQMSVLALLGVAVWYRRMADRRTLVGYGLVAVLALLWYVPGMVWFELFGMALLWRSVWKQIQRQQRLHLVAYGALFAALLTPLIAASARNPHLFLMFSGLPQNIHTLTHVGSNLVNALLSVGVHSDGSPLLWVGHAPLLNAVELALGAVGVYWYLYRQRSLRAIFLAGSVGLSLVLISFRGSVGLASLVPLLYLFIAQGLDSLLGQWLAVFPRNPIAKGTGVAVICVMLFFSVLYQTRSYFVAWPHNTATRQAFSLAQP